MDKPVGEAKILVTNEGVFVNQSKIDRINNPLNEHRHIYSRSIPENSAEKRSSDRKSLRIKAFRQRREGGVNTRFNQTQTSLSPDKAEHKDTAAPIILEGVPLTNVQRVDAR